MAAQMNDNFSRRHAMPAHSAVRLHWTAQPNFARQNLVATWRQDTSGHLACFWSIAPDGGPSGLG